MKINHSVSIELVAESKSAVSDIIIYLSRRYKSPKILPHITLYDLKIDTSELPYLFKSLSKITHNYSPFAVEISGIDQRDSLFKSLFLKIKQNEKLLAFYNDIHNQLSTIYGEYHMHPHISLIYKRLSLEEKKKIISDISIPPELSFTGIRILTPGNIDRGWEDISSWKEIFHTDF